MPAKDEDIARFTNDGVVLTAVNKPVLDLDSNAIDGGTTERQVFFDDEIAGQIMLDELFGFLGRLGRPHEAVEIEDGLSLGTAYPLWPAAPGADLVDEARSIDTLAVVRGYSFDMTTDRYALELVGVPGRAGDPASFDSTKILMSATTVTWDANYRVPPVAPEPEIPVPAVTFDSAHIAFDRSDVKWDIAA